MSNLPVENPSDDLSIGGLPADLFWEKYKGALLGGIAAVTVIAAGVLAWLLHSHNERVSSEARFAEARTPEEYRAVIEKYPGTPVAGNASLLLAAAQRPNLKESTATYEALLAAAPKYPLRSSAALGLAANAELANDPSKAGELYQQAALAHQDSYGAPFALYAAAELQLREGKRAEALKTFRNLAGAYSATVSGGFARMQAERLSSLEAP
ncbi:MAG TPA: hypothetical protein VIS74_05330 [Chthoniobacterales bacterium]